MAAWWIIDDYCRRGWAAFMKTKKSGGLLKCVLDGGEKEWTIMQLCSSRKGWIGTENLGARTNSTDPNGTEDRSQDLT